MQASPPALAQALAAYAVVGGNIVVVEPAAQGEAHKYGIVALGETAPGFDGRLAQMTGMVEKPPPGTEPSNLFISGRYILQPEIMGLLGDQRAGAGGEIQLTDAMARLMRLQGFHAFRYDGATYDCGDKVGLLRANVAFALAHPTLGAEARAAVERVLKG
jgi:UTP--glucose-1-phosphate uridylyltransferase